MSLESKAFDFEMPTNGGISCILIGASRSGKSTLLKYIYKKYFPKHITMMFSMNRHADIYKDLSDKIMCCDNFHGELFREAHELNSLCGNKFPFCMISDDYVDTKIKNDPEITRALTIYRNANISSIFSFQGRTLMSAVGRNNANFICVLKQQTPQEWENVIKEFLSMWLPPGMSMREMVRFCQEATVDHQFFFIDNIEGKCFLSKLSKAQAGV
jgi:ABC-type cobalamin/Fe3+-siderophores transport system ATPase subunit